MTCIRKAFLADIEAGQADLTFEEFQRDIQDERAAVEIAYEMLDTGIPHRNYDESEDVFEVYSITSAEQLLAELGALQTDRTSEEHE